MLEELYRNFAFVIIVKMRWREKSVEGVSSYI